MTKLSFAVLFVTMGLLAAGMGGAVSAEEPAPVREVDKPEHVCVHDPSIFADTDGTFYLLGSHTASASSDNLIAWKHVGSRSHLESVL